MEPPEIGRRYDEIAAWWDGMQAGSTSGLGYVRRAARLPALRRRALDVGCGTGRLIPEMTALGYGVLGLDVSEGLLGLARERHPGCRFLLADVCTWAPPPGFDLIVAWDSLFHAPRDRQGPVVARLCDALAPGGAILFTAGGVDGEIRGVMNGRTFGYASLDDAEYLRILKDRGCRCLLLERDQHPEDHVVLIGVKG